MAKELDIDDLMVAEMQYLVSAAIDAEKELEWATSLGLPFNEVRAIVEEIESRLERLAACAQDLLIEDELDWDDEDDREKPREIESAQELFAGVAANVSKKLEGFASNASMSASATSESAPSGMEDVKRMAKSALGSLFGISEGQGDSK